MLARAGAEAAENPQVGVPGQVGADRNSLLARAAAAAAEEPQVGVPGQSGADRGPGPAWAGDEVAEEPQVVGEHPLPPHGWAGQILVTPPLPE